MSQQINLYNAAFRPQRELLTAKSLAIATLAAFVLVVVAATWARLDAGARTGELLTAQAEQKTAQERLEAARRASETRKPSVAIQDEIKAKMVSLTMRDEVLAALQAGMGDKGSASFAEYLRGLGRQSINGLWLTGFAVSAGGADMSLTGRALDKSLLPDYVRRLNGEKAFAGKSFAGLRMEAKQESAAAAGGIRTTAVPPAPTSSPAQPAIPSWIEFHLSANAVAAEAMR